MFIVIYNNGSVYMRNLCK